MFTIKHRTEPNAIRAAYDDLYRGRWIHTPVALYAHVVRLLEPIRGGALLDVACGNAPLAHAATAAGLHYYGVDSSRVAIRSSGECGAMVGDGSQLAFANSSFEYVVNVGSLEHFLDMDTGVREMARVLKNDGRACILVPNAFGLTWNILNVWRTGQLADDDGQPLQRFGTRQAWHDLLEANGLIVLRTIGYERSWPNTWSEWQHYLTQPKDAILALLAPWIPTNLCRMLIFVCTKQNVV
jgi:SAM-dependent methyltransferase